MSEEDDSIAIIGMAARVPGAQTLEAFWHIVREGCVSLTRYDRAALFAVGLPESLIDDPQFVPVYGTLEDSDSFDAGHFSYTPREAQLMDPQQRLFLETAWHALEDAAIDPRSADDRAGVFAGCSPNRYLLNNLLNNPAAFPPEARTDIGVIVPDFSAPDYIASRVAFHLGLRGPTMTVQTACSTGLVAVSSACQSLLDYRCNIALAGASSINGRGPRGYLPEIEGMTSLRGICAPLDASADGSVFGDGVGAVVLKRLEDALRDRDPIRAVIRGWAIGNDGNDKAGFAAPGITGQMETVMEAITLANVEPADLGYIELHGSATRVGDPIEVLALHKTFVALGSSLERSCALGSVKGNLGHLDAAAGIVGLIKTVLVLEHGQLPPMAGYSTPNPLIELDKTNFFVPREIMAFGKERRFAGVSSIGLGGTNAHVVLKNAPDRGVMQEAAPNQHISLVLSASSASALRRQLEQLASLADEPSISIQDTATTLLNARAALPLRVAVSGRDWAGIGDRAQQIAQALPSPIAAKHNRPLIFTMTGTGLHYRGMARALSDAEPIFWSVLDDLRTQARQDHDVSLDWLIEVPIDRGNRLDLHMLMRGDGAESRPELPIAATHAGIVAMHIALVALLATKGIHPDRVLGHSLGEFSACHAAGMLDQESVLRAVIARARLIEAMPEGGMLSVPMSADAAQVFCDSGVWLSAINAPEMVTLCAKAERMEALKTELKKQGYLYRHLDATRAYHSPDLQGAVEPLAREMAKIPFTAADIPLISNLTGETLDPAALHNGQYWSDHLVQPVQWARSVAAELRNHPTPIFVEIGPGSGLSQLIEEIARAEGHDSATISTVPAEQDGISGDLAFQDALGALWCTGHTVPDDALLRGDNGQRAHLWTYPFDRNEYWIDPPCGQSQSISDTPITAGVKSADTFNSTMPALDAADTMLWDQTPDLEASFRAIFGAFLGRNDLSLDDDFILLGGHSLLALQISNAVWKAHRIEIPVRSILKARTLRKILAKIEPPQPKPEDQSGWHAHLTAQPLTMRNQTIERLVMDRMENILSIGNDLHPDTVFGADIMRRATPDLIQSCHRDFDLRLYPNELNGSLTVHQIAMRILNALGLNADAPHEVGATSVTPALVGSRDAQISGVAFVLSSVRSGSTLLRVMLAGHPNIFAPPELHLARYVDMYERAQHERSPDRDQGLVIALTELYGGDRDRAETMIIRFIAENWATADVFRTLQEVSAPRLLIDKSPGNSNSIETLSRLETLFDAPRYIHLYRHPYSVIESVKRNRFTALMETPGLEPEELGDYLWHRSNANISNFLGGIPENRVHTLAYEDLVVDPEAASRRLCDFLGLSFDAALLTPYEGRRMRDGLGDPNFANHDRIRSDLAQAWRQQAPKRRLSQETASLSRAFGYDLLARDLPRPSRLPSTNDSEEVHPILTEAHVETVLLRPDENKGGQALVCFHALDGSVDLYRALASRISVDGPIFGLGLKHDAARVHHWSIPDLARVHSAVVSDLNLGDFQCLGWSFGGVVAFETAQVLGHKPPVILLDSPAPFNRSLREVDMQHILTSFVQTLFATFSRPIPQSLTERLTGTKDPDTAIDIALDTLVGAGLMPETVFRSDFADRFNIYRSNILATNQFERSCKGGLVQLLRTDISAAKSDRLHPNFYHSDGMYGWSTVAHVMNAQSVPCTHYTMLLPDYVAAIADALAQVSEAVTA